MDRLYAAQRLQLTWTPDIRFDRDAGTNFYPVDLAREEWERQSAVNRALQSPWTVVRRSGGGLIAIPYSSLFEDVIARVMMLLDHAERALVGERGADFVSATVITFCMDGYLARDRAWATRTGDAFELLLGPLEELDDTFAGWKRSYQGVLGLPRMSLQGEVDAIVAARAKFDRAIAARFDLPVAGGHFGITPIDVLALGGWSHLSMIPVAQNLPNDAPTRAEVGSRVILSCNIMEARWRHCIEPGLRLLSAAALAFASIDALLRSVMMHEASHACGMLFYGCDFPTTQGPLEELKADVFALAMCLEHFPEHLTSALISKIAAGLIGSVRNTPKAPHSVRTLILVNALMEDGALWVNDGTITFNPDRFPITVSRMVTLLVDLWKTNDDRQGRAFLVERGGIHTDVAAALARLHDIPMDIDPTFDW